MVAGTRSSGSAGSKGPKSGATLTSTHAQESEEDLVPEKLIQKNASKRACEGTNSLASPAAKMVTSSKPAIGKKGSLRTLYIET
ncbi:hypothetical protein Hanom_Chr06g00553171 [Helianthus anomalus]